MKTKNLGIALLILIAAAMLSTRPAQAAPSSDLAELLKGTGLKFSALEGVSDCWTLVFDSDSGPDVEVTVTYNDADRAFALIFSTVLDEEKGYQFSEPVLAEAMKLNNDWPGVKLVYDDDFGDIDCQTEVHLTNGTVTPEELAFHIQMVAARAEQAANQLKGLK